MSWMIWYHVDRMVLVVVCLFSQNQNDQALDLLTSITPETRLQDIIS